MKKIFALVLSAVMLLSSAALSSYADSTGITENPPIEMPKSRPNIDGNIEMFEGWSAPAAFDRATTGFFWRHNTLTTYGDLYFAYSDDGLYFAAEMTEHESVYAKDQNGKMRLYTGNSFAYSVDEDPDNNSRWGSGVGWDGDVVTLMLDPASVLYDLNYWNHSNYTPWYNVGLFNIDGRDVARVYRTRIDGAEITDQVDVAGKRDGQTWSFELFIPWDLIIEDIFAISDGRINFDVSEFLDEGFPFKAAVMYMDRFYDEMNETNETWGRFVTVCKTCEDGTPGHVTSGTSVKSLGLDLSTGSEWRFDDIPSKSWYTRAVMFCNDLGIMSGTGDRLFSPNVPITRAMFVTILSKIDAADTDAYVSETFGDVPNGTWYSKPVEWAVQNGYAAGTGRVVDGKPTFSPTDPLTRETLAQFLYNYTLKQSENSEVPTFDDDVLGKFDDADSISAWAYNAVKWALGTGLISGTGESTISPKLTATRAQVALIVKNYIDPPAAPETE